MRLIHNSGTDRVIDLEFNVLSRLKAVSAPPTATMHLKASMPPLVDTARYDKLRDDSRAADTAGATAGATTEEADHEA